MSQNILIMIFTDTGSLIIINTVQLRGTPAYLLQFLLEIVSAVVRWVSQ